jgi:hypothetical protein
MKKTQLLISVLFLLLLGCNSDNDNNNNPIIPPVNTIIGKWYVYKNVEGGQTNIGTQICAAYPNCKTYEFKANGTCIFVEFGETTYYQYTVEGDFIKFFNPNTEALVSTCTIILLTSTEFGIDQTDEVNYYRRI